MSEMLTFGELYKDLRRERNILQQTCCKGIIDKKRFVEL